MTYRLGALMCAVALAACGKKEAAAPVPTSARPEHRAAATPDDATPSPAPPAPQVASNAAPGPADPAPEPAAPAPADDLVARGAYLADVAACGVCHTPVDLRTMQPILGLTLAGGAFPSGNLGDVRRPNITPDPATGVGSWSDAQLLAAIREGRRPDGTQLHWVMPYAFFNRLTQADGDALVASLRSVAPVVNEVARNADLPVPRAEVMAPDNEPPTPGDPVSRGSYVADLMHCAWCHSPRDEKTFTLDLDRRYAGGARFDVPAHIGTGYLVAGNLTPDPATGLARYSEEDLVRAILGGVRPDGSPILGPMIRYAATWAKVREEDALAVAKYLQSLDPIVHKVPPGTFRLTGLPPGFGGPRGPLGPRAPGGAPAPAGPVDEAARPSPPDRPSEP